MATLTEDESSQERGGKSVSHQQRWAAKERRRSSDMKSFVSDKLELADNPKIIAILNRNGISLMSVYVCYSFVLAGENMVLFSDTVVKVNRRGRLREWWMMITGRGVCLEPIMTNLHFSMLALEIFSSLKFCESGNFKYFAKNTFVNDPRGQHNRCGMAKFCEILS